MTPGPWVATPWASAQQPGQYLGQAAAAQPQGTAYRNLQPVPREGTRMTAAPADANPTREGWNLQWRRSAQVVAAQPIEVAKPATTTAGSIPATGVAQVSATQSGQLQPVSQTPQLQPVSQTAWMTQPTRVDDMLVASPQNGQAQLGYAQDGHASNGYHAGRPSDRIAQNTPSTSGQSNDFFADPFGDGAANRSGPTTGAAGQSAANALQTPPSIADQNVDDGFLFPPSSAGAAKAGAAAPQSVPAPTAEAKPMNDLRDSFGFPQQPDSAPAQAAPKSGASDGPSLGEMLREEAPDVSPRSNSDRDLQGAQELPPKRSADDGKFEDPFPRRRGSDEANLDALDRDRLNDPRNGSGSNYDDGFGGLDDDIDQPQGISCSDFRQRMAFQTIDKISLDISPPYRPDEMDQKRYDRLKSDFDEKQSIRQWRTVDGTPLAVGRMRDIAYENVLVETEFGTTEELPVNKLSEADLAYISENWRLPTECLIEQVAYTPRAWTPMTMTYKASNLCHTPLYFEDVNLERYGHTRGPVLEPIVQTAHFFGNIAVLPYKMGVHAPNECTYSLGYYRPGNCAPWIKPPVPISLRGALYQTAAVTGAFWLIP
ncbi:hypothetical protein K227x_42700 [Rubripirellula lacrimiformis]|uniref:SLA1 homology domain-containing protein n=1 Tax=Rubripirellula lacrimiformis TaxID=1930273 RepID=A0A517NFI0_9BACT|nr:hypothetical protein [Rubripirellula lacrimiformis]QDT05865.1 hypothetical protein K227x_42700 [Rubripirellula lacrimiformis]